MSDDQVYVFVHFDVPDGEWKGLLEQCLSTAMSLKTDLHEVRITGNPVYATKDDLRYMFRWNKSEGRPCTFRAYNPIRFGVLYKPLTAWAESFARINAVHFAALHSMDVVPEITVTVSDRI